MIGLKNFKKALQTAWDLRRGTEKTSDTDISKKASQENNPNGMPNYHSESRKDYLNPINDKRQGGRERSASGSMNIPNSGQGMASQFNG